MIASVTTATLLGLFAGLAPGPYTTMVAATGLERGFRRALPIALAPLITDVPPMIVSVFVVQRLHWTALTILGLAGGVVVAMVGVRLLRAHAVSTPPDTGQSVHLSHVIGSNLLNPAPWVFWFVVAAPLLLVQWRTSTARGVAFVVVLFLVNVGSAASLAWMASHARSLMAPANQRRVLVGAGLALTCAGTFMVWQALEGNFQALIEGQTAVRSVFGGPR